MSRLLDSFACIGIFVVGIALGWAAIGVAIALVLR